MIKTCTVCLREFETGCATAKYCPNCRAGSYRFVQRQYRRKRKENLRAKVVETRNKFLAWREQNRLQKKVC